jgi:hypothetical protein
MASYPTNGRTLLAGAVLAILILGAWEMQWRAKGEPVAIDESKGLWAAERAKIEKLTPDDVVIIGSSRALFNLQLDEFEAEYGRRPIQLAAEGSAPMPVFTDIVERSKFSGILIVGVTPVLYYLPFDRSIHPYNRISNWVDHYYKRTYADRLNFQLSKITESNLAFLQATEESQMTDLDLYSRIENLVGYPEQPRVPGPPQWPAFGYASLDRNKTMYDIVSEDPEYAARITAFWEFIIQPPPNLPPPDVLEEGRKAIIGYSAGLIEKFEARGGKVIYLRSPSTGPFRMSEKMGFPRESHWDALLEGTGAPGYHFEDYEFMSKYTPPEWSHLSTPDARTFTTDFVRQLKADGHL